MEKFFQKFKGSKEILWFLIIQSIGWGGFSFLRSHGVNYIDNYLITTIYFINLNLLCIYLFRDILKEKWPKPSKLQIALFLIFFIILSFVYYICENNSNLPNLLKKFPEISLINFNFRYILTKSLEILFQQITIIFLILLMHRNKVSLKNITIFFATVFPLTHLVNYFFTTTLFALIFQVASIIGGLTFPYLIIKIKNGFLYTYLLHWTFYLILKIILALIYLT